MSIVLNEVDYAEKALEEHFLGVKPVETLTRVARYYTLINGAKKPAVRAALEDFMIRCDPGINLVKWQNTIDRVVKGAKKYALICIDHIPITEKELAACDAINGRQAKRLLFTLICFAKYGNIVNERNDSWVNRPDKEVFGCANIVTSVKRQSLMLHDLREAGLISFSRKVDNINTNVLCVDHDGPAVLKIEDFRNLGYQYSRYCGEAYFECEQCGIVIKRRSNSQKYCHDCAADVNRSRARFA